MDRVELQKAESYLKFFPGTWFRTRGEDPLVLVSCGFCGERASLAGHTIEADGSVQPSLVCPTGCGWHVYVRLVGWSEET